MSGWGNIKINKNVIKIMLILILTIFFCLFFIQLFSVLTHIDKEDLKVSAAYNFFSSGELKPNDSNYTSNTEFEISNKTGFLNFSNSVYNGCTFSNKTVTLTGNIDFWDQYNGTQGKFDGVGVGGYITHQGYNYAYYSTFRGNFNGNGYTISDFYTLRNQKTLLSDSYEFEQTVGSCRPVGLFCSLSGNATIENLKVKNFSVLLDDKGLTISDFDYKIGGICGFIDKGSNVKIQNCKVLNFDIKFIDEPNSTDAYTGGIVGYVPDDVNVSILNCKVSGLHFDFSYGYENGMTTAYLGPYYCGYIFGALYITSNVSNIVFDSSDSYRKLNDTYPISLANGTDVYSEDGGRGYFTGKDSVYSTVDTNNQPYAKLNCSSIGGTYDDVGKYWYYAADYSDYPILRTFIEGGWKTVSFSMSPNGIEDPPDSIQIPYYADKKYSNTTSTTISIYDQPVTAPTVSGYKFTGWTANSVTSYTAKYVEMVYKITFVQSSGINPSRSSVDVKVGDTIRTESDLVNNIYRYIITHKNNYTTTVEYNLGSLRTHTIKNWGIIKPITGNRTIIPVFQVKNYDITLN